MTDHITDTLDSYTTAGSVRGTCGHRHGAIATALECLRADQRDCASARGYSDRRVVRCDGEPLCDGEREELLAQLGDEATR